MKDIENPESEPVIGEHPVFGICVPGCRVFDAGSRAVFYELGDIMGSGDLQVCAKNMSLVLLAPVCQMCITTKNSGPRHNGSKRCESGSIASGGKNSHCTCDTCF